MSNDLVIKAPADFWHNKVNGSQFKEGSNLQLISGLYLADWWVWGPKVPCFG
jgi:hypothetical protein